MELYMGNVHLPSQSFAMVMVIWLTDVIYADAHQARAAMQQQAYATFL
jgi:hypothetical protein